MRFTRINNAKHSDRSPPCDAMKQHNDGAWNSSTVKRIQLITAESIFINRECLRESADARDAIRAGINNAE